MKIINCDHFFGSVHYFASTSGQLEMSLIWLLTGHKRCLVCLSTSTNEPITVFCFHITREKTPKTFFFHSSFADFQASLLFHDNLVLTKVFCFDLPLVCDSAAAADLFSRCINNVPQDCQWWYKWVRWGDVRSGAENVVTWFFVTMSVNMWAWTGVRVMVWHQEFGWDRAWHEGLKCWFLGQKRANFE